MRIAAIAGVTAALVLALASPVAAAAPPEDGTVLLKNPFTDKCLDSNGGGSAYTNGCDSNNNEGQREVPGLDVATSEDGAGWLAFLRSLVARGLGASSSS